MKPQTDDLGSAIRTPWLVLALGMAACTGAVSGATTDGPGTGPANGSSPGAGATANNGTGGANSVNSSAGTGAGLPASGGSGTAGGAATVVVPPFAAVPSGMHRLTATQFANSLNALLGGPVTLSELDDDLYIGGFATTGASLVVTSNSAVAQYQTAIDGALAQVFADTARRQTVVGCAPKTPLDSACAGTFVKTFGRLAWRRALTQTQIDRYTALAMANSTALADPWAALQWTASALLNSPNFLYRTERGTAVAGATDGRLRYTGAAIASKLAFLIWNSAPDAALLDAADQGQLDTTDGLAKEAQSLLDAPQGHESIRNFARELINLGRLDDVAKDATVYPSYTTTLPAALSNEFVSIWEGVAFTADANAMTIFTTPNTFVNKELGAFYGLPTTGLGATASPVTFPTTSGRSGILTSGALLALEANQKEGSPTLRGKMIREQFMCQLIPAPPPNVTAALPDIDPSVKLTKRERLAMHESVATCAACHSQMDPVGFALEHFDGIGAYRALDNTKPIDTTGTINTSNFDGAQQLGAILAGLPVVTNCLVLNMYRYATGHQETAAEQAAINQLGTDFTTAGSKLKALILKTVTNDGFVYTAPEQQ